MDDGEGGSALKWKYYLLVVMALGNFKGRRFGSRVRRVWRKV